MATWKKVIVSGSDAILNQLNVSTNQQIGTTQAATFLTGSFNGSFTGDGSGLTGVGAGTVESISTGTGLTGGPITGTGTIAIDTSVVATLASPTFTGTVSGITKSMVGLGNVDNTTDAGKPVSTAQQTALNLKANLASPTFTGTVSAGSGSFSGDLTVDGDLVVNGDLVTLNTANLAVEDRFILLNSGSSTGNQESGIIFGGANGTANSGTALIWKGGYQDASSNPDGRLAIANTVAADDTAATPSYYIAGVYEGSAANAATAQADHIGNIRIENNEIFIFA